MEGGIHDLVQKILWGVGFIAIGGGAAIIFFVIFAQGIVGVSRIQRQLEGLKREVEKMNEQLKKIAEKLGK